MLLSLGATRVVFGRLLRVPCVLLAAQACGGDAGGAGDGGDGAPIERGATEADVADWCGAICERSQRCGESGDEAGTGQSCPATCTADLGSAELIQQRVAHAFEDCFSELSCARSDDSCIALVAAELELDLTSPLLRRCISVQDECGGFSDDFCSFALVATPAGQTRLDQCLSSACDAVPACLAALRE